MIFDMITQRFSSLGFHSLGILKFSTVDFLDSFLGYIVQCSGRRGSASLFTHFTPFFCTFFLSKSPHLLSYKAFSFFQQALLKPPCTRVKYPDSSLADLYDPLTMPPDLTKAHQNLDKAVDLCYRPQPFVSELNRIEFLFNLYENLTAPLLKTEKKKRTKKAKNSITNQDSDITD
jgi:hypothetical protein